MRPSVELCYEFSLKNQIFRTQIRKDSPQNTPPGIFSSDKVLKKIIFASVYYGWLIAEAEAGSIPAKWELKEIAKLRDQ